MADNISFTASDINELKNTRDVVVSRLDATNYKYEQLNSSGASVFSKTVPLVGAGNSSLKIYTGIYQGASIKKGSSTRCEFNVGSVKGPVAPVINVTIGAANDVTDNNVKYNVVWVDASSTAVVWVTADKDTSVNVHLTAIAYG